MTPAARRAERAVDAFLRACPEVQRVTFQQMARRLGISAHRMIAGWIADGAERYAREHGS